MDAEGKFWLRQRARNIELSDYARRRGGFSIETCLVLALLERLKLPRPIHEHEFAREAGRAWRFDLAWPDHFLAIEIDGGAFSRGRHTRGAGFEKDIEKLNAAVIIGWRVLRFTTQQVVKLDYPHEVLSKKELWTRQPIPPSEATRSAPSRSESATTSAVSPT